MMADVAKPARSWSLVVASLGLVALAIWMVLGIIENSGHPGHYYQFRNHADGFVYPTADVAWWCGGIGVELAVALGILWLARRTHPSIRMLACVALFALPFGMAVPFAMHAPPYYGGHIVWLFFAVVWLVIAAVAGAIEARIRG